MSKLTLTPNKTFLRPHRRNAYDHRTLQLFPVLCCEGSVQTSSAASKDPTTGKVYRSELLSNWVGNLGQRRIRMLISGSDRWIESIRLTMVVWPDELGRQWLFDATSVPIGVPLPRLFSSERRILNRGSRWSVGSQEGWNRPSEWTGDDNTAAVEFMLRILHFHNLTCGVWNVAHLTPSRCI